MNYNNKIYMEVQYEIYCNDGSSSFYSLFFYTKMLMFVAKKLFAEAENENIYNVSEERNISVKKAETIITIVAWGASNLFMLPIVLVLF